MTSNSFSLSAREALKFLALANLSSLLFSIVVWLALSLGSPCLKGGVQQRAGGDTDAQQTRGAPSITARPERVTVTSGQPGSTQVSWDTGNGSTGFVLVTANGRRPALFATGSKESRVAPWIQAGSYLFELYGDAERQTLLATVTVSGVTEPTVPTRIALWQRSVRWLLLVALIAILYIAVYFSSTGPLRTKFPVEPTTSPHPLHVARNLLLGVAAFICLDGAIFHTELYVSVLAPDSYAGRMAVITRAEKQRVSSGLKEVLVLGDSRMAEGFSTAVADQLGSVAGLKFVNLAEPASSANTWHYMLREVDPTAQRYWAIVIPYGIGYEPNSAESLRISMAAPLLRYGDCFDFACVFQRWSGRFRAFTACILRGSAFQSDVVDLLEHPISRVRSIQQEPKRIHSRAVYKGRDYDIVGTTYDPRTGQITFPPQLTTAQRQTLRESLVRPPQSETQQFLKLQRDWIPRILSRYSNSPTTIVLTPVPRGPFGGPPGFSMAYQAIFPSVVSDRAVFSLPDRTFNFLEKPEFYFDGYHLNAKGRQRFTETLVTELVGHLASDEFHAHPSSESKLVADRLP